MTEYHNQADGKEGWGKYIIGGLILAAITVGLILFFDVDQTKEGNITMPKISVEGGDVTMPEFDVDAADVDIKLPSVDVDVTPGSVEIDLPKEGTEADDISALDGAMENIPDVDVDVDVEVNDPQ